MLKLKVGDKIYSAWQNIVVTQSLDRIAGGFAVEGFDIPASLVKVNANDLCTVTIDDIPVIHGFIDKVTRTLDADQSSLTIEGRDKAADLVDCTVAPPYSWKKISLARLVSEIASPYGIPVSDESSMTATFDDVQAIPGESCYDLLERYAGKHSALIVSDARGGVRIINRVVGNADVDLVEGKNILSASGLVDYSNRFHKYIVDGQHKGGGLFDAEKAPHIQSVPAIDSLVRASRELRIIASGQEDDASSTALAKWDAIIRAARSNDLRITVVGWQQKQNGRLWQINERVRVFSETLAIDEANNEFLINEITFKYSHQGTTTELSLLPPDAYTPKPEIKQKDAMGGLFG